MGTPVRVLAVASMLSLLVTCQRDAGAPPSSGDADPAAVEASSGADRTDAALPIDWAILHERLTWAYENRLDSLPMGDAVVAIGQSFVGTPYQPRTLEIPGPERLVVNFEALDCVTFVENVLALARFVKTAPPAVLNEEHVYRSLYQGTLRQIRYRGGSLDGYPSRLHYFTDWIADGEAKGLMRDVTADLGGVADPDSVDFMSTHPDAYRQLSETETLERVRTDEIRLTRQTRLFVPEDRISEAAPGIQDGDIIAAASTVAGLDVAHTGIAIWLNGNLHLMHAPLVGDSVQISERTLPRRIQEIGGQDGIAVARPLEPGGS
jgi:hypothetical protein